MSERSRKSRGSAFPVGVSMMAYRFPGCADEHLLAVGRNLVAGACADLGLGLLLEVVDVDGRLLTAAGPAVVEARTDRRERAVVRRRRGDDADPGDETVRVHLDGGRLVALLRLGRGWLTRLRAGGHRLRVGGGRCGRLLDLHFVALGRERVLRVLRERDEVDPRHVGVDVLELRLPVRGVEAACGDEEEQLAVGAEDRFRRGEPGVGGRGGLLRFERIEVDALRTFDLGFRIGDPPAVRRPRIVGDLERRGLGDLGRDLRLDVDDVQTLLAIGPHQLPAVG